MLLETCLLLALSLFCVWRELVVDVVLALRPLLRRCCVLLLCLSWGFASLCPLCRFVWAFVLVTAVILVLGNAAGLAARVAVTAVAVVVSATFCPAEMLTVVCDECVVL